MPRKKANLSVEVKPTSSSFSLTETGTFVDNETGLVMNESGVSIAGAVGSVAEPRKSGKTHSGNKDKLHFSDLELKQVIGSGAGGTVRLATDKRTSNSLAVKVIPLKTDDESRKSLSREIKALVASTCPYIIKLYGIFFSESNVYLAMEFMDHGSLRSVMNVVQVPFPEEVIAVVVTSTLRALDYLHNELRITHRDLKPENVLIHSSGSVKVTDFGVSGTMDSTVNTFVGTLTYLSPERIAGRNGIKAATDIWSLGIMIMEMATCRYPYPIDGPLRAPPAYFDVMKWVVEGPPPSLVSSDYSLALKDLVAQCLNKDPELRATENVLLESDFVRGSEGGKFSMAEWLEEIRPTASTSTSTTVAVDETSEMVQIPATPPVQQNTTQNDAVPVVARGSSTKRSL